MFTNFIVYGTSDTSGIPEWNILKNNKIAE